MIACKQMLLEPFRLRMGHVLSEKVAAGGRERSKPYSRSLQRQQKNVRPRFPSRVRARGKGNPGLTSSVVRNEEKK